MKKAYLCGVLVLLLLAAAAMASAAGLDDLAVGVTHADALTAVQAAGLATTADTENMIVAEGEAAYVMVTFDEQGAADWVNLAVSGNKQSSLEVSVPDWTMRFDDLLARLKAEGAGYDLYLESAHKGVFFGAQAFGAETTVYLCFLPDGQLEYVMIEDEDEASNVLWAAQMGAALGVPDEKNGPETVAYGDVVDVLQDLYWERSGCCYYLESRLSMLALKSDGRPAVVYENDLRITITPFVPDAEQTATPTDL